MFRCEVCDSVALPRTRCYRIVVGTRPVDYPKREKVHWHPPRAGGKGKRIDDPGGHGTAIVRELRACEPCMAKAAALERRGEAVRDPEPAEPRMAS
jgi:hypothetical protein